MRYLPVVGETRYRGEFDYYSIGLVLLEICFWSTLTTLTNPKTFKGASLKKFRKMINERKFLSFENQ